MIFYEVIDATDDEMYFPLGIFSSLEAAEESLAKYGTDSLSEFGEDSEVIKVIERKEGMFGHGKTVREYSRNAAQSDSSDDDSDWVMPDMSKLVSDAREHPKQGHQS